MGFAFCDFENLATGGLHAPPSHPGAWGPGGGPIYWNGSGRQGEGGGMQPPVDKSSN